MLEYECYPLWIYDEKGSLIDNDLIDEIKKDDTLCGMLEGLQTEFERLYVNNQIEFKYVGFSSENAKQNFAKKQKIYIPDYVNFWKINIPEPKPLN